uniref:DNA topoisomerase I n=2 Tax=Meloidogyne incognita group TaxID=654580 RepID=A0A914LFR5_MELIC
MAKETEPNNAVAQQNGKETAMNSESQQELSNSVPVENGVGETNGDELKRDSSAKNEDLDDIPWSQRIREKQQNSSTSKSVKRPVTPEESGGEEAQPVVKKSADKKRKTRQASPESEEEYTPKKKSKSSKTKPENPTPKSSAKKETKTEEDSDYEDDKPAKKKKKSTENNHAKQETSSSASPTKKKKKAEEEEEVWKWWEEQSPEQSDGTIKWRTLEHKGPMFAPEYVPLPKNIKFKYNGKPMDLSPSAEEVATFYAKMLDHDYTSKPIFNQNFFKDWRKTMTSAERSTITDLKKCDFRDINAYFLSETEKRKARSKEEKKAEKEIKDKEAAEYGFAMLDGYKQKIGNFRIEPPGLFRGRGEHPKMGCLKLRVQPEDVIINCSKGVTIPPPKGHKWKEVRHDNMVTWLCSWNENVLFSNKYIMLNPSSKLKGQKDWEKFEKARKLKGCVGPIRDQYLLDFKSKEMRIRQRAVALYFIDKFALRAGNEKDTDEAADTVGCCSLRCEHIKLHEELDNQKYVVEFDFLGKDSIRYYNRVPVEKAVFKNLKIFMEGKEPGDDLFDRLDFSKCLFKRINGWINCQSIRTYNASITLQDQLDKLTNPDDTIHAKLLSYNRANRQVAILCNHQRAVPKTHDKAMETLQNKINEKKKEYKEIKAELKKNKNDEKLQKKYTRVKEQLVKLKTQHTDKDENKQIALGTSKLNYLDPRISVAWCKKYDIPIEKIYSKTQRDKFRWAIDMTKEDFIF